MTHEIVSAQREYYLSGATRSYEFRMDALASLKAAIQRNEQLIMDALKADLNKSGSEAYIFEIGLVLEEISYHEKHLREWMRERTVPGAMGMRTGKSFVSPEPYGVTLIMSPWNYPVNLCFEPLVGAISCGNTAVIKPSAYAPRCAAAFAKLIGEAFAPEYITVVEGGREENAALLNERFDYIFFTGSVAVGRTVMAAAAKNLTPVTLELGGKSPVIVDETANIPLAAKRVAFGKTVNAGQTCVAPDYLFIHESVKDEFIENYKKWLKKFFPKNHDQMVTIISDKHYKRVKRLLEDGNKLIGGGFDDTRRFIEPTVIDGLSFDSPIMQEEIFGPLLPVFAYKDLDECIAFIRSREKPLALYMFSECQDNIRRVLDNCAFGGGCINDTLMHLGNANLPFGGVGNSGMGSYHGEKSFETFSHFRSVFHQSGMLDEPVRYMPYSDMRLALMKKLLK